MLAESLECACGRAEGNIAVGAHEILGDIPNAEARKRIPSHIEQCTASSGGAEGVGLQNSPVSFSQLLQLG